jgi:hypothetical protein
MQEQTQSTSTEQGTSTEQAPEQTLEQVYKQFNVEETANQFQPQSPQPSQPAAPQQPMATEIPDPILDPQGFKSWSATQAKTTQEALSKLQQTQQQIYIAEMQRREEADIKSAVAKVKEKVGDIDDDFVEIALGQKARKDPKFMAIYQNRHKNPSAWNAALGAVASEFKGKYQYRTDPQLTENLRAAKQSQGSLTTKDTGSANPIEERLGSAKTQAEFDRMWREMQGA